MRITREEIFGPAYVQYSSLRRREEVISHGQQLVILALRQVFFAKTFRPCPSGYCQLEGRFVGLIAYGKFTSRNASWRLQTVLELVAKMVFEAFRFLYQPSPFMWEWTRLEGPFYGQLIERFDYIIVGAVSAGLCTR